MKICMWIHLLVICQYVYKFLPKYLQLISIFFRLSFYIAFSWQKGHMETIGTYGRKDLLWDQIVVCLLILNNIQGIFLLWHKILCCEEVSQYRSLYLFTLLGICHLFTYSSNGVTSRLIWSWIVSFISKFYPMIIFLNQLYYLHKLGSSSYLCCIEINKKAYWGFPFMNMLFSLSA